MSHINNVTFDQILFMFSLFVINYSYDFLSVVYLRSRVYLRSMLEIDFIVYLSSIIEIYLFGNHIAYI